MPHGRPCADPSADMFEYVPPRGRFCATVIVMETNTAVRLLKREYDIFSAPELEAELSSLQPGTAVIDFTGVTYIDSSALTLLIATLKRMREREVQSTMVLRNLNPSVRRLFELTNLTEFFVVE
jgi:anti-anti-sigma factor